MLVIVAPNAEYVFYFFQMKQLLINLDKSPDHALGFKEDISNFLVQYKNLHGSKLSDEDWDAVSIVVDWLHVFHEATTQMSCTNKPMLLTTHAVFHGLQEELQKAIAALPKNVNRQIKLGLLNVH